MHVLGAKESAIISGWGDAGPGGDSGGGEKFADIFYADLAGGEAGRGCISRHETAIGMCSMREKFFSSVILAMLGRSFILARSVILALHVYIYMLLNNHPNVYV